MGGAVSKGGALVLLFGFVCVSIIVSLLSLLYFISIANFWWLVKGFERKRGESWVFLCFGEVGGKGVYFIGALEGLWPPIGLTKISKMGGVMDRCL